MGSGGGGTEFGEGVDECAAEMFDAAEGVVGDGVFLEIFDKPEGAVAFIFAVEERRLEFEWAILADIVVS